jgi:hypothetical protein
MAQSAALTIASGGQVNSALRVSFRSDWRVIVTGDASTNGCSVNLIRTLDTVGTFELSSATVGTLSASSVARTGSAGIAASLSTFNSLSTLDTADAASTITLMSASRPFPFGVVVGGVIGGVVLLTCTAVLAYFAGRHRITKGDKQLQALADI